MDKKNPEEHERQEDEFVHFSQGALQAAHSSEAESGK